MTTCRICKGYEGQMIHYAVRHYAHADCGLQKWGAAFFDRLSDWQVEQFPFFAAQRAGLDQNLIERISIIEASRTQGPDA